MAISTLVDRVKISVLSSGTGSFQLGAAVPAFRGLEALVDGATYSYATESDSNFEAGTGVYLASSGTLVRSPTISSNGGAAVAFPAGVQISFTILAQDVLPPGSLPIVQSTGGGEDVAMSQKATTDALGLKANISDLGNLLVLANAATIQTTQAILQGQFVNLYATGGNIRARLARANDPATFASGFALADIANGGSGPIAPNGWNTYQTGFTAAEVWLSDATAGAATSVAPSASGSIIQPLGVAAASRGIFFTPRERVLL